MEIVKGDAIRDGYVWEAANPRRYHTDDSMLSCVKRLQKKRRRDARAGASKSN